MKIIAMIPARMGSQRLKKKNLQKLGSISLIERAIQKCIEADIFDEIWVNSEHPAFENIARETGVLFHKRPSELADDQATSEQFVYEFLKKHPCDYIVQVHTIAPLISPQLVCDFVIELKEKKYDSFISVVNEQIECLISGKPINFSFDKKENSQDLTPIQRLTWGLTGWRAEQYIMEYEKGKCATFSGKIGYFILDRISAHIIKSETDLAIAETMLTILDI